MDNTNQTQTKPTGATANASATLKTIVEGANKKLLGLIPKGQSPKLYVDLIKTQVMGVDSRGNARRDEDLLLFLYVCKRVSLDPLTKQIYAVFRWDSRQGREVMTVQTGIDGMRLVAQRTGEYAGQDDIKYLPEDESTPNPTKATCTVYKTIKGQKVAFTASARWSEYVQTKDGKPMGMWAKMPYNQLGKCAEALALRKGFPNELAGIYSAEEMAQSNNVLSELPKPEKPQVIHGAPEDTKKDNIMAGNSGTGNNGKAGDPKAMQPVSIGSPEAKTVTEVKKPEAEVVTKETVKASIALLQKKVAEARKKSKTEGQPVLKVGEVKK